MSESLNKTMALAREYSPLTLSLEWPKMGRLIFMVACSSLGSIMNGFFVAAFFVEVTLRKAGNVFHACVGLSDLIITVAVIPTCAVVLLSGQWDTDPVCNALQFITESATYSYNIFYMFMAVENYLTVSLASEKFKEILTKRVGILSTTIFCICFAVAGVGVYLNYDYNYCSRGHFGEFYFRIATAIMFQFVPFTLTTLILIVAIIQIFRRSRKELHYKRSHQFDRDICSTVLNITAYIFFAVAWTPYVIIVNQYPDISDAKFYHSVWLGISRSVVTSFLYACLNRNFRRAFAHLFNYCCCKNSLSSSFNNRNRRDYRSNISDIRVHIMHQAIVYSNPPRYSSTTHEVHEL